MHARDSPGLITEGHVDWDWLFGAAGLVIVRRNVLLFVRSRVEWQLLVTSYLTSAPTPELPYP